MRRSISLVLCLALTVSLAACSEEVEEPQMDPTVMVETTTAQTGSLSSEGTYIGTISAEGTARVVSLVSGTVEELYVEVGDTVSAGSPLCRIDDESARLTLESALAGLQTAQAAVQSAQESYAGALAGYGADEDGTLTLLEEQVRLAEDNYADTQALFDIGAASQAEVDQARQTLLSAQAGLESAQAALSAAQAGVQQAQASVQTAQVGIASAEYQLTLYNLSAPISGVVEAVNVTQHNFAPSGTAAFVISNGEDKTVTFYVTDAVRQTLVPGQPVTVRYDSRTYEGVVTEIGGVVDAAVGQFQVKAVIDGAQDLPDGLAVELTTTAYQIDGAVLIPSDAMFFEDGVAYVYAVQDGTAVRTDVTIGLYTAETIAVTAGLEPGAEIITTWSSSLRDGALVQAAGGGEAQEAPAPEAGEVEGEAA